MPAESPSRAPGVLGCVSVRGGAMLLAANRPGLRPEGGVDARPRRPGPCQGPPQAVPEGRSAFGGGMPALQALAACRRQRRLEHVVVADLRPDTLEPRTLLGLHAAGADDQEVLLGRQGEPAGTQDGPVDMAAGGNVNTCGTGPVSQLAENRRLLAGRELAYRPPWTARPAALAGAEREHAAYLVQGVVTRDQDALEGGERGLVPVGRDQRIDAAAAEQRHVRVERHAGQLQQHR